jgi:Flp pilus assembly pilin Flp
MFRKTLARLHKDEQGIEALQAVLIMAIAAVVLAIVKLKWPAIKEFFNKGVDEATTFDG